MNDIEWRWIGGYENIYQVSNSGLIRSVDRTIIQRNGTKRFFPGQIIVPKVKSDGYLEVTLHCAGVKETRLVHRIVAETFIPNPNHLPQVDHIDSIKSNNSILNLQWITMNDNLVKRNKENFGSNRKQVQCIETGIIYPSMTEASRQTGVNVNAICQACKGKYHTAGTHHWKIYEKED